MSIGCGGADRQERLLYEIVAKGFSAAQYKLFPSHIYFMRGTLFPSNTADTRADQFIFEGSDVALVGPRESFHGDLVDTVGVTGLGIVVGINNIVEQSCQYMKKSPDQDPVPTTVFTVQHSDYHPIMKTARTCNVEYRVRPTPNLAKIASFVRLGRECQFHGYIKDFNEETSCYVVVANKVIMTNGFQEVNTQNDDQHNNVDNTLKKPKKFKPKGPNTSFKPATDENSGITTADFASLDTPFSSSSTITAGTSTSSGSSSLATPPDFSGQVPKKRARYQPKRKAAKEMDEGVAQDD
ncbi:uncharacterized protein MELLADRAFT_89528 [Melampsora larici-populina 98AG31]|uniref:Uncharacterized protein n=1 Tax=Melampsora larici-populina (strain 98AG31 / pathotype 3-4-7) TaxID=747676 RepID=F4RTP5_MELLP|nr:uncharacterized protein MELLADRAFT_89528 [Melampsora larici-populina 98AG31]EGG04302.1 hypothetical protein MELLADRAFT_89528 [Melampsora larici-populina 98AG31]